MNPYLLVAIKQTYRPIVPIPEFEDIHKVIKLLDYKSQILCGLEAAKLVLPIWEEEASKSFVLTKEQKKAPKKAVEIIKKWLEDKASVYEVSDIVGQVRDAADFFVKESYVSFKVAHTIIYAATAIYTDTNIHSYVSEAIFNVNTITGLYNETHSKPLPLYIMCWDRCYASIANKLKDKYDDLCKAINGDI